MQVRQLDLDRPRDVRQFVQFPFELYRHDPLWVPPLLSEARQELNRRKHPFHQHGMADAFVVEDGGRTCGRLLAMVNNSYVEHTGRKAAFFGFFEVMDDAAAAQALFAAAFDWARARGMQEMVGPKGLFGATSSGILVQGFEHPPAMSVAYNPPYYDTLVHQAGFTKESDSFSGYLRGDHTLAPRFYELADKVKERRGLTVKSFDSKREMRAWIPRVAGVYNEAFRNNAGFYPLSEAEFALQGEMLIAISEPGMMKLVLRGEEVVGFLFAYPNINEGLRKARGRLLPLGWWHLLREQGRTRLLDINGVGLLPSGQGVGASVLLYTEMARTIGVGRFDHVDVVLVDETNARSRADMEAIGVQWYKCHRTYRRAL